MIDPWEARRKQLEREFTREKFYSEAGKQKRRAEIIKELEKLDKKLHENAQNRAWEEVFGVKTGKPGYTGGRSYGKRLIVSANRTELKESIRKIKDWRRFEAKKQLAKRKLRKVGLFRLKKK